MKTSTRKLVFLIIGGLMMILGMVSYFFVTEKMIQINTTNFIIVEVIGAMIAASQIDWLKENFPRSKNK